jgi:hypothetical protein
MPKPKISLFARSIACVFGNARWLAVAVPMALAACASTNKDNLVAPKQIVSPYDTSRGEVLWAIVPLRNETGTTLVDPLDVSDKVMAAAAQIQGVRAIPVNRTIAAMRNIRMTDLATPADARRLASELGADALVVGSITAWDPYRPTFGLSLALYIRPGGLTQMGSAAIDVSKLRFAPTDYQYFPRSGQTEAPSSVVSEYLDGQNHQVLMDVKQYAQGRHEPVSALGWRRYTASMPLFTEFGAWEAVSQLIDHEWIRLAKVHPAPKGGTPGAEARAGTQRLLQDR